MAHFSDERAALMSTKTGAARVRCTETMGKYEQMKHFHQDEAKITWGEKQSQFSAE